MRAVKNFVTLFIGDALNYLLNFVATIYLARNLEVSNFGKISFAFAFFSFSSFITNLGLISIGTRDIAQRLKMHNTDAESTYISNVINLRQVLALITFILLLVTSLLIHKPMPIKLLIILYGLSLFPFALLMEWAFFGWEKMDFITIERVLVALSYLMLVLFFVRGSNQLSIIPIVFLVSNLVGALFLFFTYRYHRKLHSTNSPHRYKLSINFKDWLHLIKTALPFGIGAILIQFPTNFNTIFLGMIKPDIQVGLFSAAYKFLVFILIFDRVMNNTTFPIISRYYVQGSDKLSEVLNRLAKLVLIVSIPICVGGFLLARGITNLIYGSVYEQSFPIFQILIWFFLVTILNSLYTSTLIAGHKNKEYIKAIGFGALANIVLNIVLVPIISAFGTAIALVVGELVTLILLTQLIKPIAHIKFKIINIIKPIFATIVMALCIWLLHTKLSIIPLVVISALVYIAVILLIKGISKSDLALSNAR
jgi:O-antigen/teichoic acid export membrane protein